VKSFSQAYTPMNFDTSCYWVNSYDVYYGGPVCEGNLITYIEKDTIINSTTYFKMSTYFIHQNTGGSCPLYLHYIPGFLYIRDDTTLRQVLAYNGANPETVLIDFGLDSGDVFNIGNQTFTVDSTDTFFNYPRIQYFSNLGGFANGYTIEGMGRTINFPYTGYGEWGVPYFRLTCYSKNGITLFGDPPCPRYWPLDLNNSTKNNLSLHFYDNILTLNNIMEPSTISVYSLLGNEVFTEKTDDNHYSKDLSSVLQNGFYIVTVHDKKNKSVLKVFIQ
jgi:hypothetical protein